MKARITGFRGSRRDMNNKYCVVEVEEQNPASLIGEKVSWITESGKSIHGKIVRTHGKNKLMARFFKGLPGTALGTPLVIGRFEAIKKAEEKAAKIEKKKKVKTKPRIEKKRVKKPVKKKKEPKKVKEKPVEIKKKEPAVTVKLEKPKEVKKKPAKKKVAPKKKAVAKKKPAKAGTKAKAKPKKKST